MTNPLYDALIAPHAGRYEPFILRQGQDAFSYADFVKRVAQTANALTASGLGAGDRLAIQASKSVGVLEIYAACIQTGVIFLPLNTAYTDAEIDYFLSDAEPALFICDPDRANGLIDITGKHDTQILTLGANENGSFADLVVTQPESAPVADRSAEDIAALLYTSGTTGRSKGAMLTQGNLLSNAEVLIREWRITKADRLLHALPVFHAHGLFVAVNTSLLAGAQLIYLPAFVVDDVLVAMPKATTMMGVPTFYTRLLDDARFTHDVASHMRLFISGSAPLLAETHKAFEARTGPSHSRALWHDRNRHEHNQSL
jgi:malonyl-CoA/methylmalonyl-CoA synthetase